MNQLPGVPACEEFRFTREQLGNLLTQTTETYVHHHGTKPISSVVQDALHTLDVDAEADRMGWRDSTRQLLSLPQKPDLEVREALSNLLSHPLAQVERRGHQAPEADPVVADWNKAIDSGKAALAKANGQSVEQTPEPPQKQQQQRRGVELSR